MNIFDVIEKEHDTQRRLMKKLLDTSGKSDERRELFIEFCREFRSHAAAEEHAFYAPMMESTETTDQSRHSVAEHHDALELLEKLENTDMSSSGWLTMFKKLVEDNEHHMEEEENDVFTAVKKEMSKEEIESMRRTFEERKRQELTIAGNAR